MLSTLANSANHVMIWKFRENLVKCQLSNWFYVGGQPSWGWVECQIYFCWGRAQGASVPPLAPTKKNQFSKTCKRVNLQQYFLRCGVDILSKKGDLAMLWKIHLCAYLVMLKKMLKIIKVCDCVMGVWSSKVYIVETICLC